MPPLVALAFGLLRCGSDNDDAAGSAERSAGGSAGTGGCFGFGCGNAGNSGRSGSGGSGGTPPEQEVESSFRSPVATGKYVWAANPESGRVAFIDALSLEVKTIEARSGPTHLAAVPSSEGNRAIVLNVFSHDATLLAVGANGDVETFDTEVHRGANSWAVSANGRWAIAWTDAAAIPNPDPIQGFQDITVIELGARSAESARLSVGYRPTRMFVSADEKRAFVVSEPGVSVIELESGNPRVSRDIAVTDDPLENPASRDVTITPDGAYALVRRDGSAEVGIVSLVTGERVSVALSGGVTDLDLSEDGTRAIAVVREPGRTGGDPGAGGGNGGEAGVDAGNDSGVADGAALDAADALPDDADSADAVPPTPASSEVAILPIPGIFTAPSVFDRVTIHGETVGSVALAGAGVLLLYTNATPNDRLTIVNARPGAGYLDYRRVALKAPVQAVFGAADAEHAIALLKPAAGSTRAGAFAVVPLSRELPPKIQGTDAPPLSVAIAGTPSRRAILTVRDDVRRTHGVYLIRMPELQVDLLGLASPPLASGIVQAAESGFVAQEHPEGRITLLRLSDGKARTLTGFELGAKVVDGSKP